MTTLYLKEESLEQRSRTPEKDGRAVARHLLAIWGAAPLLYFALLPDKRYLYDTKKHPQWSIAYRKIGRYALALGDPMGDPHAAPEAADAFIQHCRRHRWTPAFYQVTPDHLPVYRAAGLHAVKIGEEARIALDEFSLAGKRFKNLRNDLRRIEKAGVVREEFGPGNLPDPGTVREMTAICDGWRRAHRAKEAGFAMGAFDPQSALFQESRTLAARDLETGRLLAFATFVPAFGPEGTHGWTLDLMRRRADALHGVMDFLIVSAAQQFAAEGRQILSLGLSPLSGADEPGDAPSLALVRRFLYRRLGRVYNFQGLYTFKAKFATHWEPRYLVTRPGMALTLTAGAILKAHLTSGEPKKIVRRPSVRGRGLVLAALLLLLLSPFEKTLARRAVSQPRRWAHFRAIHFHPHLLHPHLMHFAADQTWGRQFPPDAPVA